MNNTSNFVYAPKKETCPACKGNKRLKTKGFVAIIGDSEEPSQDVLDIAKALEEDDRCPACCGEGQISVPPYGTGEEAKISDEKVSELAKAGTLLRCIDEPMFVQAVANEAARIKLPEDIVANFVGYWNDPARDVNLGEYIRQIAQASEELAMKIYGNLKNGFYAFPRPHDASQPNVPN